MNIGNNIKYLRVKKQMTQEQVADQLGVTYQAVSKWETGANTPDISLLPSLASLFGVAIDALFSDHIADVEENLLPAKDDDVIRIVQMRGRQVVKVTAIRTSDTPAIEIAFPRNCNEQTQYFKVEIYGHVVADGSINGDVVGHQSIQCGEINGDVRAEGDIKANEIRSFGKISCNSIRDCYQIDCAALECSGEIHAEKMTCDQIIYRK